jgi:hypothetical protein
MRERFSLRRAFSAFVPEGYVYIIVIVSPRVVSTRRDLMAGRRE